MKDDLGDRIKSQYEDRTRISLPRRTYTVIRLDGKAFHTYTRGLKKPFDSDLYQDMDNAIIAMLPEIQGAVFAYTQSDEISILLTDFATPNTDAWFDGNLQKMCSVSASIITAEFNKLRLLRIITKYMNERDYPDSGELDKLAYFDARIFTIPDRTEVMNYFIWRNQDCSRNSLSMVAQSRFSHKELQGKNSLKKHEMLYAKGINWATDFTDGEKNGRLIIKEEYSTPTSQLLTKHKDTFKEICGVSDVIVNTRSRWVSKGAWKFTENMAGLLSLIPKYE